LSLLGGTEENSKTQIQASWYCCEWEAFAVQVTSLGQQLQEVFKKLQACYIIYVIKNNYI
jgi:CRISPR/Cas system-associated endoribonuclease Cas2